MFSFSVIKERYGTIKTETGFSFASYSIFSVFVLFKRIGRRKSKSATSDLPALVGAEKIKFSMIQNEKSAKLAIKLLKQKPRKDSTFYLLFFLITGMRVRHSICHSKTLLSL